ncbi:hypothetical protein N7447_010824 [Penicillium robsamsonii]|uniref:uncharacterized protein n=1 Tax=Penicillium robsamsonii TaxID=1792511 RepID=UPI0025482498|nr:uncharacterized protein N7447_010824 [Penicillium robsamsonii]KAJ5807368.1 hypothetical protein N7447_010824 [Penicillium robsamsonii]
MHISYISLALFAVGAIAAPAAPAALASPKPTSNADETATGFPFTPIGSFDNEDIEEGLGHSFSSALEAMKKSAQHAASSTATPTHEVATVPTPVVSQASTLSHAAHAASQTPEVSTSASTTPTPTPSKSKSAPSSSASSSSAATPSPTKPAKSDPLGDIKNLPVIGQLLGGPMAALGLHR